MKSKRNAMKDAKTMIKLLPTSDMTTSKNKKNSLPIASRKLKISSPNVPRRSKISNKSMLILRLRINRSKNLSNPNATKLFRILRPNPSKRKKHSKISAIVKLKKLSLNAIKRLKISRKLMLI